MSDISIKVLLEEMNKLNASDLHLTAGSPPRYRIDGKLLPSKYDKLTPDKIKELVYNVINEAQRKKFEMEKELDFSFGLQGLGRYRGNLYIQRSCLGAAFRKINTNILGFKELGLPEVIGKLAERPRGMILVTGPTGSGKSTTLAAILDKINSEYYKHIITIEDPIEFVHHHKKSMVNQREVYSDTNSFHEALKHVLRQDPDVILIGEMRDKETLEAGLTIAETGHLCLATLHTNSAAETINRIVDAFPANQQSQIRAQLSFCLEAIIAQTLLPKLRGGRVVATEILIATPAIRAIIRDNKIQQIYSHIQAGQKYGMHTLNQSLYELVMNREISLNDALRATSDPAELQRMLGQYKEE